MNAELLLKYNSYFSLARQIIIESRFFTQFCVNMNYLTRKNLIRILKINLMTQKNVSKITIGALAKQANVRTSTLRYYEKEGLLIPAGRTPAGYRTYNPSAIQILQFIQRAQRLGFSLADIRLLLDGWQTGNLSNQALIDTAEARHLAMQSRLTELLVQQHELQLFLQDIRQQTPESVTNPFTQLVERICHSPLQQPTTSILDWLLHYTDCNLHSPAGQTILQQLRQNTLQHVHIWQENDSYHILLPTQDPTILQALQDLASLESHCHAHPTPALTYNNEGYLFTATGPNAFIFARLFLALETERTLHNS